MATLGTKGFVYPSQRLAEAAGYLLARDTPVLGLDFVLEEKKAQKAWKRCDDAAHAIVHVSTRTLLHDLNVAGTFQRAVDGGRVVVTGVGLESHRDTIEEFLPGVMVDVGPTGYEAARLILGLDGELGPPDTWPDACWKTMPLAKSRRLPIYHGRGCVHGCDYCPYVIATQREFLARSPGRTVDEVAAQATVHRPKRIVFRDPVFGLAPEATLELLAGIARLPKRSRAPFEIETRPEQLSDEMLDALRAAGCVEIKLGVESFEAEVLIETRRLEDRVAVKRYADHVDRVLAGAAQRKIIVRPYLMKGLPGSTAKGEAEAQRRVARHFRPELKNVTYPEEAASRVPR